MATKTHDAATRPVSERTTPAEAADKVELGRKKPAPTEDEIRVRAYAMWEEAGRPDGDGASFWYQAEKELTNPR